ncbi:MAG: hypothetical protein JRI55_41185 [Deltaproteobacteria bacterium]|jgi:hypothetical protein|nr:hypothetical protein [Deltaproteobacteria bacterium]
MTGLPAALAALATLVVASLLAWWLVTAIPKRRKKTWRTVAAATGLEVFEDGEGKDLEELRIEGPVTGGVLVASPGERTIYNTTTSNQYQAYYTINGLPDIAVPRDFVADRSGLTIGGPERKTGDPTFDEQVHVGGADEEAVLAFLTPPRRQALISFFAQAPDEACWTSEGITLSRDIHFFTLKPLLRDLELVKALMAAFQVEGP